MAIHNTDRLTLADRELWRRLIGRPGTFSADEIAAEFVLPWDLVRNSLIALLAAGKLWRAEESLSRYTATAALKRRDGMKIGKTGTVERKREHRVNRRAPG